MTSDGSLSNKLRLIGELEMPDHWYLEDDDECYFFGDYTPRAGFSHSDANQLIANLKKDPKYKHHPAWRHKVRAISKCGIVLGANLNQALAPSSVVVPIPPSKPPDHADYDDRMAQVAAHTKPFRAASLLRTREAREPLHHSDNKRDIDAIFETLEVDGSELGDATTCFLLDDVITTGASFRACVRRLRELPQITRIIGIFIARCARPKIEFPLLDV